MPLDLNTCLFLDFEARSEVDITEVGAHAYAEHLSTELLCCGWVVGLDAEVKLWRPGEPIPETWWFHAGLGTPWVAHNKDTERLLLQHKLRMDIPAKWWIDCATVTSAAGMPRNLHDVAESLHLDIQKMSRTAMLALARPRKVTKTNSEKWWTREEKPELYAEMEDYCRRDVDLMRKALVRLPPYHWVMPPKEEKLAVLTDKMNDLGVEVDTVGIDLAAAVVAEHGAQLRAEFAELFPGVNPRHAPSAAAALGIANSRKETVRDELKALSLRDEAGWSGRTPLSIEAAKTTPPTPEGDMPADADAGCEFGQVNRPRLLDSNRYRALTVLKTIKTASTAKLKAFQRHACKDGRIHGAMVFHGAGRTGRWSSMGVQLHNLVRGLGASTPDWPAVDESPDATDIFFGALHAGILDLAYRDVTRAVAAAMRGFLLDTKEGLLSGDFSQIEARVLVDWAGQEDMVEAYRRGRDTYKLMAARIYSKAPEAVDYNERFMGKRAVLGAGFGVGKFGFQANLKNDFNIELTEEEADRIVQAYRTSNRRVVALWYAVERLAKQTLLEQPQRLISATDVPRIGMRVVKDWLIIRLPSGRCLWYFEPELVGDGAGKQDIMYWGRNVRLGGRWDRVKTYGGKLVENITQAIARDVMAEAMLRLDAAGFNINLTVHDDIVAPGPAERLDEFKSIMLQPPAWWPTLPIDVEVQHKRRYQ